MLSDRISDLVRALDRAESNLRHAFVALEWFRDGVLPTERFDWAQSGDLRETVLREDIKRRFVLTSNVPNLKSPKVRVTAIRLNRFLPDIQAIPGEERISGSEFHPIKIRGESLSTTVLRDRR